MKIRQISFRLFVWLQRVLFCEEKLSHVSHVPVHAPLRTMVSWCLLVCAVLHMCLPAGFLGRKEGRGLFGSPCSGSTPGVGGQDVCRDGAVDSCRRGLSEP